MIGFSEINEGSADNLHNIIGEKNDEIRELKKKLEFTEHNYQTCRKIIDELQRKRMLFDLLSKIVNAPDYVQDNVLCYYYHNTTACQECPKLRECPNAEPQPNTICVDDIKKLYPTARFAYYVRVGEDKTLRIPNPNTNYTLFCDVIQQLYNNNLKQG